MAPENDRSLDLTEDSSLPNDPDIYIYSNSPKACHLSSQEEVALVNHQMLNHTLEYHLARCQRICCVGLYQYAIFQNLASGCI